VPDRYGSITVPGGLLGHHQALFVLERQAG